MTLTLTPLRLETETVAVLAARHLSWHRVQCPAGVLPSATAADPMGARLRTVLIGLLEDRLLDEPDTLHFALQPPPYSADGVWVAVCDRAALAQAVQQLAAQGHVVHRLVPECAPLPQGHSALWLTGSAEAPRPCGPTPWACTCGPCLPNATDASTWPTPVQARLAQDAAVQAEPAVAAWAERALDASVPVLTAPQRWQEAALAQRWNLAQGSLSLHKPWPLRLQQGLAQLWSTPAWRPARWMAALLLLVQLVGLNAAAWQARRQEQALRVITPPWCRAFPRCRWWSMPRHKCSAPSPPCAKAAAARPCRTST